VTIVTMVRKCPAALLALLLSIALAAPARASAQAKPKPKPLPAFDPTLAWSDCGDGFECATLTVPVDWTTTTAGTVGLALVRLPATAPDERRGSLVLNYGGPGQSGVDALRHTYGRLPAAVREHFDVVSFDPRGTGASRPVDCVDDALLDQSSAIAPVPASAAELDALHRYNAQFAAGCHQRTGAYAGQVGTRNVARDLEAIRIALGDPKLSYVGYSYGAALGAVHAQMFPNSVGRVVLDGPPDYWISARDAAYRQARGFMSALSGFLDWCQARGCSLAASGPPRQELDGLVARVARAPLPASYISDGVVRDGELTSALLENAVLSLLYDRSRGWPLLADALSEAVNTGTAPTLLSYADMYVGRAPDGRWEPLVEANAVISCVDQPARSTPTRAAELADVAIFQSQLPPWGGSFATATCIGMPKPAQGDKLGVVRVRGTAPILVIGTTDDPATPYVSAEAMAARIQGSGLLTFESVDHTAFARGISTCIDTAVVAYLLDGTIPPPGTRCSAD
jgi:pimeloyl-ACP methyl ester carboxylesterase